MFVKIKTVFDNNRTISDIQDIYNDKPLIKKHIFELIEEDLINSDIIQNKVVLLKPNWVLQNRQKDDELCLRTNNCIIFATLEIILEKNPRKIIIGDAPVQGCIWQNIITEDFKKEIINLSSNFMIPIEIIDFRKVTFNPNSNIIKSQIDNKEYLIFDLGKESNLEPVSQSKRNPFRITYYNPDRLKESHFSGTHKYCLTKTFFDADIVISLPKIKTHQKTGITGALKNLVGINGDKDYLPHHRIGGSKMGGDCYPGNNYLKYFSELLRDMANRNIGSWKYRLWSLMSYLLWHLTPIRKTDSQSASWHGNDTSWRMVLDLNKIATYGNSHGQICSKPQRTIYSICDGIIAGQGDGPLNPIPLPLGIISFCNHSAANDIIMATIMGFNYKKIPLLYNSVEENELEKVQFFLNGNKAILNDFQKISVKTIPPPGWQEHLK